MDQWDSITLSIKGWLVTRIFLARLRFLCRFQLRQWPLSYSPDRKWNGPTLARPQGTRVQKLTALFQLGSPEGQARYEGYEAAGAAVRGLAAAPVLLGFGKSSAEWTCHQVPNGQLIAPASLGFLGLQPLLSFLLLIRWAGFQSCQIFFCPS